MHAIAPPQEQRSRRGDDPPALSSDEPYRGPYLSELGMLTVCPIHPWDAPNLSIVDGAAPVCFTTGHLWDEADARRAAR